MVNLMEVMARHGITPVIISASQVDVVDSVLQRVYHFGPNQATGMRHRLHEGLYRAHLLAPATYRHGKVDAAREIARHLTGREDSRPVLCAGDSDTDLEFVAYSSDCRIFFDRGSRLFMGLARHLQEHGAEASTVVQQPFERVS
jgi:phosphoserine phosphatase